MLRMMALPPDGKFLGSLMKGTDSQYCYYASCFFSYFIFSYFVPLYFRSLVIHSLTAFINQIQLNESHTVHLLKALPLLHLLHGDCAPHEQCVVRHAAIDWKDPAIDLRETQQIMTHKKGSVVVCQ